MALLILILIIVAVCSWCIGMKMGADYEYDRTTEYYMMQAKFRKQEFIPFDRKSSFKEKLEAKMKEHEASPRDTTQGSYM